MDRAVKLFVIAAILVMAGCGPKTVTIMTVEPGLKEIQGIQRLAVLDLTYEPQPDTGRNIANMIVAELDQTGTFVVMERSAVARVLQEQKFSTTSMVDAATASSIGKLLGVDGVVVGEVVTFTSGRKAIGKEASVRVNIRLVDVESGRVVTSDSISINTTRSESGEHEKEMLNRVAQMVAKQFIEKIAPHYVEREKYLLSTGGDAGTPNKRGITFAANNLWDKAQEQFEMALKINPHNGQVQNNLAVCHEHFGRLKEAIEAYELAIGLDPDDQSIQKNLASVRGTFREPHLSAKEKLRLLKNADTQPATGPSPAAP